ncbi:MAG TPA: hypothetical protein VGE74_08630 [Gemmata sp.]
METAEEELKSLKVNAERHKQLRLLAVHGDESIQAAFERHCGPALDAAISKTFTAAPGEVAQTATGEGS